MKAWKVVLASDHAGLALKRHLSEFLKREGCQVVDVGTHAPDSCDYPDFAAEGARRLAAGEFERGIFVCGSGVGIAMAANKISGIRAASCAFEFLAELTRRDNDANVLCLGERVVAPALAEAITKRFLETEFAGGRHARRLEKIGQLEREGRGPR